MCVYYGLFMILGVGRCTMGENGRSMTDGDQIKDGACRLVMDDGVGVVDAG